MNVYAIILVVLLFGTIALSITGDLFNILATGGSEESWNKLGSDVSSILDMGNSRIERGVDGLVELEQKEHYTDSDKATLSESYRQDIFWGSAITLCLIGFFTFGLRLLGKTMWGGNPPPMAWLVVISVVIVAVLTTVFGHFDNMPFSGWIDMLANWDVVGKYLISGGVDSVDVVEQINETINSSGDIT